MFNENEKSKFPYYFAHLCAYNARETMYKKIESNPELKDLLLNNMLPILNKYKI